VNIFWTRGEVGQFLAILCGRPLWMAPKKYFVTSSIMDLGHIG